MKSIIAVSILFLSFTVAEDESKDDAFFREASKKFPTDLCSKKGPEIFVYVTKFIDCMKKHLKKTGEEAEALKCIPKFEGPPGQETDKKYCKKNSEILKKAKECIKKHFKVIAKNEPFMKCIKAIPGNPGIDFGELATENY
ncbi:uncharacterized protein LOC141852073 [Brevipalpus obovatus]|uniref:uncharacterized protein LOC141852073 n=1 Tax=Brevipalpus obovatus TaxID=246614 RepID=UPI003D9E7DA1